MQVRHDPPGSVTDVRATDVRATDVRATDDPGSHHRRLMADSVDPPVEPLSEAAAEAWIPRTCFKNGPPGRIGVELEMLVADARDAHLPAEHLPWSRLHHLWQELESCGLDGRLTFEPGGQVELSSRPGVGPADTVETVSRDLDELRQRAAGCGAKLIGIGVDPIRAARRVRHEPRYAVMEQYFDTWGPAGRAMMCSTASVQINVEAAVRGGEQAQWRWELLHAIGPALVAAFANSPRRCGRRTGWKSTRWAIWAALDPCRTRAPRTRSGQSILDAWTRWALDAAVMIVRRPDRPWTAPTGLTFRQWIRQGRRAVPDREPPDLQDLAYHLTTLFPPVRPRGHFEIRYIDAQPGPWWVVPTAVVGALLDDAAAADQARAACAPVEGRWRRAARSGVADRELGRAASDVLGTAVAALRRRPDCRALADHVDAYQERWTSAGRCPADDRPGEPADAAHDVEVLPYGTGWEAS